MPIERALDHLVNFGNPFRNARANLETLKIVGVEQEAILAIAAIIENYPYNNHDIDLNQVLKAEAADSGGNEHRWPWRKTIEGLWKVPPGFRQLAWEEHLKSEHHQSHVEGVDGARVAFRESPSLHLWELPWR